MQNRVAFTSNVAVVAQSDCAVTFAHLEIFAGNHARLSPFTVAPGVSDLGLGRYLLFNSGNFGRAMGARGGGQSVRPVRDAD